MEQMRTGVALQAGLLIVLVVASGCFGKAACMGANGMSGQAGVCNQKNSFSYGTNAGMTTSSETFTWENTKGKAEVTWGSNLGMGSVSVRMMDAAGKQVFTKSYSGSGQSGSTTTTAAGAPGEWTIEIELKGASGQVGISAQAV